MKTLHIKIFDVILPRHSALTDSGMAFWASAWSQLSLKSCKSRISWSALLFWDFSGPTTGVQWLVGESDANPSLRTRSSSFLHFSISISRSSSLTSFKCFSHLVRLFVTSTVRRDSYWKKFQNFKKNSKIFLNFFFKKSIQRWNEDRSNVTWIGLYLITFVSFERNLCSVASDWMLALAF